MNGPQCGYPASPQPPGQRELIFEPVAGNSRKITPGSWGRIVPGYEGKLTALGSGSLIFAWIGIRPERQG